MKMKKPSVVQNETKKARETKKHTSEIVQPIRRRERLCHQHNDVKGVQHGHHPRPPAVLANRAVVAPLPDGPRRPLLRTLRRALPLDELLQVDPLSLWLGEQGASGLGREVPDDDTKSGHREHTM